jgi:hypothetical protein
MIEYEDLSRIYRASPWTEWYKLRTLPESCYSIDEFKKKFSGRRPRWALSFKEQHVDDYYIDRGWYRMSMSINDNEWLSDNRFWRIERELLIQEKNMGKHVIVERALSISGTVKKVTLIHLEYGGRNLNVHEENKISKHKWTRTTREVDDERFINTTWPTFRDLPSVWSRYF